MAEYDDKDTFDFDTIDKWRKEFYVYFKRRYRVLNPNFDSKKSIPARIKIAKEFYDEGKFFLDRQMNELTFDQVKQDIENNGHMTIVDFSDCF